MRQVESRDKQLPTAYLLSYNACWAACYHTCMYLSALKLRDCRNDYYVVSRIGLVSSYRMRKPSSLLDLSEVFGPCNFSCWKTFPYKCKYIRSKIELGTNDGIRMPSNSFKLPKFCHALIPIAHLRLFFQLECHIYLIYYADEGKRHRSEFALTSNLK